MRKREAAAEARGGLRVNGCIEHINPHVMSNICVPGGRSSGRKKKGGGGAPHIRTQDSISQRHMRMEFPCTQARANKLRPQ